MGLHHWESLYRFRSPERSKGKDPARSYHKSDILSIFGPPDRVTHQYDGDIFVYAFLRKNSAKFAIEEPFITNTTFFSYTRIQEKKDHLLILFDKDG
jgi:hypothetical protein